MKAYRYSLFFFFCLSPIFFVTAAPPTSFDVNEADPVVGAWSKKSNDTYKAGSIEEIIVFEEKGKYCFEAEVNLAREEDFKADKSKGVFTREGTFGIAHAKIKFTSSGETEEFKAQQIGSVWVKTNENPNVIVYLTLMDDWVKKISKVLQSKQIKSYKTWDCYVKTVDQKQIALKDEGKTLRLNRTTSIGTSYPEDYKKIDSINIADIEKLPFKTKKYLYNRLYPRQAHEDYWCSEH